MAAAEQPNQATKDKAAGDRARPAQVAPVPVPAPLAVEGNEELEMALLSALAAQELGEATEEFDMTTLTPAEREALLRMLREHLGGGGRG